MSSVATEPIDGKASPRKPSVAIWERSLSGSFDVAWRSTASSRSCGRHAAAIVDDADQPPSAQFDRDIDAGRARVEGVLDELLDGGGRPLDDLARRDAIDKHGIETADGHGWFTKDVVRISHAYCLGLDQGAGKFPMREPPPAEKINA